ncbi:hypothetical protein SAMN04487950_2748 [Halogranum rubrum]|uniref:Uncharacterized protein n=1 Tax=Halogranum rubrum TaxID=553466 RepID=A0A1I4FB89_9EURY|nr:hypothetical protein SAMN04487950_2748 [Halogranum rubrum]
MPVNVLVDFDRSLLSERTHIRYRNLPGRARHLGYGSADSAIDVEAGGLPVAETVTRRTRIPMTTSTESSGQEGQKTDPQFEDPLRMQSDGNTMTDRQYRITMQYLGRSHDSD